MALLFMESFEHYTTLTQKWSADAGILGPSSSYGRFGNGVETFDTRTLDLTLPTTYTGWVFGAAFKIVSTDGSGSKSMLAFRNGSTAQLELKVAPGPVFSLTRNGTALAGPSASVTTGVWHYLEAKFTIADSGGTFVVKLNGTTLLDAGSADTNNSGGVVDTLRLHGPTGGQAWRFDWDDIYLLDLTGGSPTDTYLGDVRVECLFPSGNGNSSQFDGSDGNQTDNYLLVDETTPNDDTDYVTSPDVGDKDTYAYTNLASTTGTVYGIQILPRARKTDAGARTLATVARLSGTEVDSSDFTLSTSYQYFRNIRETKPGGGAWTITDVNNAEFGPKVTS